MAGERHTSPHLEKGQGVGWPLRQIPDGGWGAFRVRNQRVSDQPTMPIVPALSGTVWTEVRSFHGEKPGIAYEISWPDAAIRV